MEVHRLFYYKYSLFHRNKVIQINIREMRFINFPVIAQFFVHAGLLQKFAPASSALKHDETHTSDYDIDEMVEIFHFRNSQFLFNWFRCQLLMVTIHIRKIPIGQMISLNKNRSYRNRLVCSRLCLSHCKTNNFKLL